MNVKIEICRQFVVSVTFQHENLSRNNPKFVLNISEFSFPFLSLSLSQDETVSIVELVEK